MVVGLIVTWVFWPPLAVYLLWRGLRLYGALAIAFPFALTGLMYGMHAVDPDMPLFLSLLINGIVASRLVAEAYREPKKNDPRQP